MLVLVFSSGVTRQVDAVDPAWLAPDATEIFWVDLPVTDDSAKRLLADTFHFHELAIEDALLEMHHPKVEPYEGVLYLILHGIVSGNKRQRGFVTRDVDFFLGRNFLVTVHHHHSRSIEEEQKIVLRHGTVLGEGPCTLMHRIIDRMVDHYGPEVDGLEDRLEKLEHAVFSGGRTNPLREILRLKSDIASLRRVVLPQRDVVSRLARREFPQISDALSYRFRDVHDHLVRLADEAVFLQDRVTGLLDAHISTQSHRLNQIMKVLTVISTIFMPLMIIGSLYGMNVPVPHLPGGPESQFWWVLGIMLSLSTGMLLLFRKNGWL
jgi:magnesium transporter